MSEALSIVEQIIKEHQQINVGLKASEKLSNDLVILVEFDDHIESFVQRRLDDQKQKLADLKQSVEMIDKMLNGHFKGEETRLLKAFEDSGQKMLINALSLLLEEHREIRNRIAKLKTSVDDLSSEGTSLEVWEGKAYAVRAYIRHTQKLIEAHADTENDLLKRLKKKLAAS
ncbi:hemerythrin domain-containing protein [Chloroflexota bacterium]